MGLQKFAAEGDQICAISGQDREKTQKDPGVFQEMLFPLPVKLFSEMSNCFDKEGISLPPFHTKGN